MTPNKFKKQYLIFDWSGNELFNSFSSFDDAESCLCDYFEELQLDYDENRGEYFIELHKEKRGY